jgi:hypothetical protein
MPAELAGGGCCEERRERTHLRDEGGFICLAQANEASTSLFTLEPAGSPRISSSRSSPFIGLTVDLPSNGKDGNGWVQWLNHGISSISPSYQQRPWHYLSPYRHEHKPCAFICEALVCRRLDRAVERRLSTWGTEVSACLGCL